MENARSGSAGMAPGADAAAAPAGVEDAGAAAEMSGVRAAAGALGAAAAIGAPSSLPTVLLICGSLRERSLNRQAGQRAATHLAGRAQTRWLDYANLPFMNQDAEFPPPAEVRRVRAEVAAADAVWMFSPEYNHGVPGVLKNLLDWLSRPLEPGGSDTVAKGKPVALSCAGGGARARYCAADLAETLAFMQVDLVQTVHAQVALTRQDYTTDVLRMTPGEDAALALQADLLIGKLAGRLAQPLL